MAISLEEAQIVVDAEKAKTYFPKGAKVISNRGDFLSLDAMENAWSRSMCREITDYEFKILVTIFPEISKALEAK